METPEERKLHRNVNRLTRQETSAMECVGNSEAQRKAYWLTTHDALVI